MEESWPAECGLNPFRLPDILLFHYNKLDVIGYSRHISANGSNSGVVDWSLGETPHPRVEHSSKWFSHWEITFVLFQDDADSWASVRIPASVLILKNHMKIRCVIQVQLWHPDHILQSATLSNNNDKSALAGDLMETWSAFDGTLLYSHLSQITWMMIKPNSIPDGCRFGSRIRVKWLPCFCFRGYRDSQVMFKILSKCLAAWTRIVRDVRIDHCVGLEGKTVTPRCLSLRPVPFSEKVEIRFGIGVSLVVHGMLSHRRPLIMIGNKLWG
jgi:hypothetical protein